MENILSKHQPLSVTGWCVTRQSHVIQKIKRCDLVSVLAFLVTVWSLAYRAASMAVDPYFCIYSTTDSCFPLLSFLYDQLDSFLFSVQMREGHLSRHQTPKNANKCDYKVSNHFFTELTTPRWLSGSEKTRRTHFEPIEQFPPSDFSHCVPPKLRRADVLLNFVTPPQLRALL